MTKINRCIIWTNGMVWSLDAKGEHIPEYEGFFLDISDKLKDNSDENTKWSFGKWQEWIDDANLNWYWEKNKSKELIS